MPTRNVYVSNADLPLFDEAAAIAGGLSPAVATGLRLLVTRHRQAEARHQSADDFADIEIAVPDAGTTRIKRFRGRLIAQVPVRDGATTVRYDVYLTPASRFAVHVRLFPEDDAFRARLNHRWNDPTHPATVLAPSLIVLPDLAALAATLPEDVTAAVRRAVPDPLVEELDI